MDKDKKLLKNEYKQTSRPMGVFLIRNMVTDKVFVGVSLDLNGIINRHKFQLKMGVHPNARLQADWNNLGSDKFAFEILDEINPRENSHVDYREELAFLEKLWLEKLQPYDERGYNEKKLSREERLRRIAANRSGEFSDDND